MQNHLQATGVQREPVAHGTALFPLAMYEITSYTWMEERIWCHWHEEMEILVVTRGQAQMHIADRTYTISEGNIVIVPPNCIHSATEAEGEPFCFFALVFSLSFLDSSRSDTLRQSYLSPFLEGELIFPEILSGQAAWQQEVRSRLWDIRDLFLSKKPGFELLVKSRLYEIWFHLSQHPTSSPDAAAPAARQRMNQIRPILSYLNEHYNRPITLQELSETFHMSQGYLCRFFHSMTKMSVTEYLNHYRISVSTELLSDSDLEIGEIAGLTGFNNISYFNKIFRRYMHTTPSEFRKQLRHSTDT